MAEGRRKRLRPETTAEPASKRPRKVETGADSLPLAQTRPRRVLRRITPVVTAKKTLKKPAPKIKKWESDEEDDSNEDISEDVESSGSMSLEDETPVKKPVKKAAGAKANGKKGKAKESESSEDEFMSVEEDSPAKKPLKAKNAKKGASKDIDLHGSNESNDEDESLEEKAKKDTSKKSSVTKKNSRSNHNDEPKSESVSTYEQLLPEIDPADLTSIKSGKHLEVEGGQAIYFGTPVAVKYFAIDPKESRAANDNREAFEKECRLLGKVRHQNLALAMGVNHGKGLIVMQRYDMDLVTYIDEAKGDMERFKDRKVLDGITMGLARGLAYLHDVVHIVHRDLKPENILMDGNSPKISDFGLSKELFQSKTATPRIGTAEFMAPEIIRYKTDGTHMYSYEVDVYSFGLLIYYLLEFTYPWEDVYSKKGRTVAGMKAIFTKNPEERPPFSVKSHGAPYSQYKALAERCWVTSPDRRPKLSQIVNDVAAIMKI